MLPDILEKKRAHIHERQLANPLPHVEHHAKMASAPRGFLNALNRRVEAREPALITEIKKASPSKGLIRAEFAPAELAHQYELGGATCLSVLTDTPYFQGADQHLILARDAVSLPVLRKDFIIDPYQVVEARALGADAILLIMAAVDVPLARAIEAMAQEWKMDVLIEVHDEQELHTALAELSSPLIGINNRNLSTLKIDLETSVRLVKMIPDGKTVVCESGIKTASDIDKMVQCGISCFLIGESLLVQPNLTDATRSLLRKAA